MDVQNSLQTHSCKLFLSWPKEQSYKACPESYETPCITTGGIMMINHRTINVEKWWIPSSIVPRSLKQCAGLCKTSYTHIDACLNQLDNQLNCFSHLFYIHYEYGFIGPMLYLIKITIWCIFYFTGNSLYFRKMEQLPLEMVEQISSHLTPQVGVNILSIRRTSSKIRSEISLIYSI